MQSLISIRCVLLVAIALLGTFVRVADSAAALDLTLYCETMTFSDGSTEDICATFYFTMPCPATSGYMGGYSVSFDLYEGLENGTHVSTDVSSPWLTISVGRDDEDVCTEVRVGDNTCSSCEYCPENGGYSADCTNIVDAVGNGLVGTTVKCQPVPEAFESQSIFFPLDKTGY